MIPKWLYKFNHHLMIASLGLLALWIIVGLLLLPFMQSFPYEVVCWMCDVNGWAYPILLALFVISSAVVVAGFAEHRTERKEKE